MDTVRVAIQEVNDYKKLQREGFMIPMQYRIECLRNMYNAIRSEARRIHGNDAYSSLDSIYKEHVRRYVECNAKYTDASLITHEQYKELYDLNQDMLDAEYNIVSCVYDALEIQLTSDESKVCTNTNDTL